MRRNLVILGLCVTSLALACSQTTEPEFGPQGTVTLHFASAQTTPTPSRETSKIAMAAPGIDSVVVRVFRPGTPITQETSKGVKLGGADVDVSLDCIAENGKRVSVDLYEVGKFTHHGFVTGVNVVKGQQTAVNIDAYEFTIESLTVTPGLASEPEPFDLVWNSAQAATRYKVQASSTPDFATIHWEQSVTDTFLTAQLAPGSHYFRVVPQTNYSNGPVSPTDFGYAQTAGGVDITGFSAPAAIPGDVVTILGENLDVPGTIAEIGSMQMTIVSSSWGALQVIVPRAAITESISVSNPLPDFDTSLDPLIVQRVAYVTDGGRYSAEYESVLMAHWEDFGFSGVAVIPVTDVDERDMGVFDIIIVASDTGTDTQDWGNDNPALAQAIAATRANVLALGDGGLAYLRLAGAIGTAANQYETTQAKYYTEGPSATIFQSPHSVTSGNGAQWIDISTSAVRTVAVGIPLPAPTGVTPHGCTDTAGALCPLVCGPNERWALVELQVPDAFSLKKRYVYWGYTGDPQRFLKGEDLIANIMYLLYNERAAVPPASAALSSR